MGLENMNIFITGGNRGIGAATVTLAAKLGAKVVFTYNTNLQEAEKLLDNLGAGHKALQMNLEDSESISNVCEKAIEFFKGKVDGVVNNAGVTKDGLILRMKPNDFSSVLDINLKGVFLVSKAFVKPMMKCKSGSIVHITSVVGQVGQSGQANYAASKAGIEGFSKSLARELASRNIRSNCVAPGYVDTNMTEKLDEELKNKLLAQIPLNRVANVFEIAKPICFLLSSDSGYITGHTINVNGGMNMC